MGDSSFRRHGLHFGPFARRARVPWKECSQMDERLKFVARVLDGEKMAVLCRDFGISRKTGYTMTPGWRADGSRAPTLPARQSASAWTVRHSTTRRHRAPTLACLTSIIRSTTRPSPSPPAGASATIAKRSTSARSSPARPSASNRSRTISGWSASWTMIWAISTIRHAGSNHSEILSGQNCYPMSPV